MKSVPNALCPVAVMKCRLQEAKKAVTSLFGYYKKRNHQKATPDKLRGDNTTTEGVEEGRIGEKISGHYLRVGGAFLRNALKLVPVEELKELARWTSAGAINYTFREHTTEEKKRAA
jgi:hypothetical protein